jgi:hypothetical protein
MYDRSVFHYPHGIPGRIVRCRRGGYTVIFVGAIPVCFGRRPLAWGIRKLHRGANFRDETRYRQLLAAGNWKIERVIYAMTGLEGLFCVGLKS